MTERERDRRDSLSHLNVNDRHRGRLTYREYVQKYPVPQVTQRQDPGILLSHEAYEKSLPEILSDDSKKEIATAAVAATKKQIFPPDAEREVDRVIRKNFKLNKKEEQLREVPAKKLATLCSYAGLNRRR